MCELIVTLKLRILDASSPFGCETKHWCKTVVSFMIIRTCPPPNETLSRA